MDEHGGGREYLCPWMVTLRRGVELV